MVAATEGEYMKKHRRLRKPIRIALEVLACSALCIMFLVSLVGAVLQESYKTYPPTAEELAEDPTLASYLKQP